MDRENGMKLLYANMQSMMNKMGELRALIDMERPDVVVLTETWTNNSVNDAFVQLKGFEMVVRCDRRDTMGGRGGGIAVYAKGVHAWSENVETTFNQCAHVKIKNKKQMLNLYVVYGSPNSTRENDAELCEWVRKMPSNEVKIIMGDFNYPGIQWDNGTSNARGREFYETCMDAFLTQHVQGETHRSGNTLDLVLTSDEDMVKEIKMIGKIGSSDHEAMLVDLCVGATLEAKEKWMRDYGRGDYEQMRRALDIDWNVEIGGVGVEEMWQRIERKIEEVSEAFIPWKKISPNHQPRWLTGDVRRLMKEKRKAWAKWKKTRSEVDKSTYKELEGKVKKVIRNRKKAVEKSVARNAKTNPKSFFSYINGCRVARTKVGPIKDENGDVIMDPKEQAERFNEHYASVFTRSTIAPPCKEPVTEEKIEDVDFSVETVKNLIDGLKERASPGPDGINNRVLKETRDIIAYPLFRLFRKSLDEGIVPRGWKDSIISPIYKKGKKSEPVNYRPVNLTSNVCKLMERVLKRSIEDHLEKKVTKNSQHGFRPGRSPLTNLVEFGGKITEWVDEGRSVDVVYFDLSKAFDKVCHERLVVKLEAAGVCGLIQKWIREWLSERRQAVRVDGMVSSWTEVKSSTPQGTVLGGTLFTVYIDDVDDDVTGFFRKFADDTKGANIVENRNDADRMQQDINAMMEWGRKWEMSFNVEKCKVLHIGRNNRRFQYRMGDIEMQVADEEKDLGVWFDSSLKPSTQCEKAAKEANAALGMITRSFHYRTKDVLIPLYKTFVRPKLEHASVVWSPWLVKDQQELEKVQKRVMRMVVGVEGSSYEERLERVGLTTLVERRTRGDMVETFKTLRGMNRVEKGEWFVIQEEETRPTRANARVVEGEIVKKREVLVPQRYNLEIRKNFFTVRVPEEWNRLPDVVKASASVNGFKNAYDKWKRTKNSETGSG